MSDSERLQYLLSSAKQYKLGSWEHWHLRGRAARYAKKLPRKEALKTYWSYFMMPPVFMFF
jgi:hypothetical protein